MSRSDRILVAAGGAAVVLAAVAVVILLAPVAAPASAPTTEPGVGLLVGTPSAAPPAASDQPPPSGATIFVDVEGAVAEPGIRELPAGSRVADAIAAAGGYATDADLDAAATAINLAQPLSDGEQVRVPRIGETQPGPEASAPAVAGGGGSGGGATDRAGRPEHRHAGAARGVARHRRRYRPEDRRRAPGATVRVAPGRRGPRRDPPRPARGHPGSGDGGLSRGRRHPRPAGRPGRRGGRHPGRRLGQPSGAPAAGRWRRPRRDRAGGGMAIGMPRRRRARRRSGSVRGEVRRPRPSPRRRSRPWWTDGITRCSAPSSTTLDPARTACSSCSATLRLPETASRIDSATGCSCGCRGASMPAPAIGSSCSRAWSWRRTSTASRTASTWNARASAPSRALARPRSSPRPPDRPACLPGCAGRCSVG